MENSVSYKDLNVIPKKVADKISNKEKVVIIANETWYMYKLKGITDLANYSDLIELLNVNIHYLTFVDKVNVASTEQNKSTILAQDVSTTSGSKLEFNTTDSLGISFTFSGIVDFEPNNFFILTKTKLTQENQDFTGARYITTISEILSSKGQYVAITKDINSFRYQRSGEVLFRLDPVDTLTDKKLTKVTVKLDNTALIETLKVKKTDGTYINQEFEGLYTNWFRINYVDATDIQLYSPWLDDRYFFTPWETFHLSNLNTNDALKTFFGSTLTTERLAPQATPVQKDTGGINLFNTLYTGLIQSQNIQTKFDFISIPSVFDLTQSTLTPRGAASPSNLNRNLINYNTNLNTIDTLVKTLGDSYVQTYIDYFTNVSQEQLNDFNYVVNKNKYELVYKGNASGITADSGGDKTSYAPLAIPNNSFYINIDHQLERLYDGDLYRTTLGSNYGITLANIHNIGINNVMKLYHYYGNIISSPSLLAGGNKNPNSKIFFPYVMKPSDLKLFSNPPKGADGFPIISLQVDTAPVHTFEVPTNGKLIGLGLSISQSNNDGTYNYNQRIFIDGVTLDNGNGHFTTDPAQAARIKDVVSFKHKVPSTSISVPYISQINFAAFGSVATGIYYPVQFIDVPVSSFKFLSTWNYSGPFIAKNINGSLDTLTRPLHYLPIGWEQLPLNLQLSPKYNSIAEYTPKIDNNGILAVKLKTQALSNALNYPLYGKIQTPNKLLTKSDMIEASKLDLIDNTFDYDIATGEDLDSVEVNTIFNENIEVTLTYDNNAKTAPIEIKYDLKHFSHLDKLTKKTTIKFVK